LTHNIPHAYTFYIYNIILFLKGDAMPTLTVSLETIADTIKKLNKKELETLTDLLTDKGRELLKRKKDIEQKRVKALSRDEVFNV